MIKAIIINDTSLNKHHGCELLMNEIDRLCEKNKIKIVERCFNSSLNFGKKKIINSNFNLALVNGEGSLHNNQQAAHNILDIVEMIKKNYKVPIILINSSIFNLNKKLISKFKFFDKIFVRDSESYKELIKYKIKSIVVPDLLFNYKIKKISKKKYIIVTDAHQNHISKKLISFAIKNKLTFLPIKKNIKIFFNRKINFLFIFLLILRKIKYLILTKYNETNIGYYYENSNKKFLEKILESEKILTGRFHFMVLCIILKIPFFALKSNTPKIERLFLDVGLNKKRIVKINKVNSFFKIKNINYTKNEIKNINKYILYANKQTQKMFNLIKKTRNSKI